MYIEGTLFVDANILIYADLPKSAFNEVARQRLQQFVDEGILICVSNQIIREYLSGISRALLTSGQYNPAQLVKDAQRIEHEYEVYEENAQTRRNLLTSLGQFKTGGKQVHDANIVARM